MVLGEGALSYERGTPAGVRVQGYRDSQSTEIISMIKWSRTSRLSIKNSPSGGYRDGGFAVANRADVVHEKLS